MKKNWFAAAVSATLIAAAVLLAATQQPEKPYPGKLWEYRVESFSARSSIEDASELQAKMNSLGHLGWELVAYQRPFPQIPKAGTMLIHPAATANGRSSNPPTADSFQGTITLDDLQRRREEPQICIAIFKRECLQSCQTQRGQ